MYKLTERQEMALDMIVDLREFLGEGGSRSGKTFLLCLAILTRAVKHPGTRHLIARFRFNHAKQSIWYGTIPEVAALMGIAYKENKSDWFLELPNKSQIWIGGLDDKERTEKILGTEFATIYLNEASQISYSSYSLLKTRLNPPQGVPAKLFIDYNPPSKRHWGYKLFHRLIDPITDEPIAHPEKIGFLKMNPRDNLSNLSEGYLETLESLSERDRARFLEGEYLDPVGAIYTRFNESMVVDWGDDKVCESYVVGVDLITYCAVLIGKIGGQVYIQDEIGGEDLIASELNTMIVNKWAKYRYKAFIDWNLSKSGTREFDNSAMAKKGPGSVEAGIDLVKKYMENENFFIHEGCVRTRGEIEDYRRDENGKIVKQDDHYIDAMRYALYSSERQYSKIGRYR